MADSLDPSARAASIGDHIRVPVAGGTALARVIGWADSVGRPSDRATAHYIVVIGDISAGEFWDQPRLFALPPGRAS